MFQYFMGLLLLASTLVYASKTEKSICYEEQRGEITFAQTATHINHYLEENVPLTQNGHSQEEPINQHSGEEKYTSISREDQERKSSQKKYVEKGYRFNIFDVVNPN